MEVAEQGQHTPGGSPDHAGTRLIGRERELAALDRHFERAAASHGGTVTISAGPGLGKTALAEALIERRGSAVLRCAGLEAEFELPYSGLQQLLLPLLAQTGGLPERQRAALSAVTSLETDGTLSAVDVALGSLALLTQHAASQGVVVVLVDDLHWIDEATAEALSFVAARVTHEPVLIVATRRPAAAGPTFGGEQVHLEPLAPGATTALAERCAGRPLFASTVEAIHRATGGNPLAVIETVRLVGDDVALLGTPLDEPLPASSLIELGFSRRVAALPEPARLALAVVATALTDAASSIDGAIRSLDLPADALDDAESAGLIVRAFGAITFAHPMLRSVVYHAIVPADRRRINGALAGSTSDASLRAWHAGAASRGFDNAIAVDLETAAADFGARGGNAAAARALERAARLSEDPGQRARRFHEAGHLAATAGRSEWAETWLVEAAELATDPVLQLKIAYAQSVVQLATGGASAIHHSDSMARLARQAAPIDRDVALDCLVSSATSFAVEGEMPRALAMLREANELGPAESALVRSRVTTGNGVLLILSGVDPERGRELIAGVAQQIVKARTFVRNTEIIAEALAWLEEFDLADAVCRSAIDHARQAGHVHDEAGLLATEGYVRFRTGDWAQAAEVLDRARHLSHAGNQRYNLGIVLATQALLAGSRGDAATLTLVPRARVLDFADLGPYLDSALGIFELSRDDAPAALVHLESLDAWCAGGGYQEPGIFSWQADLVDAYALNGQHKDAQAALGRLRTRSERSGTIWPQATIARLEATLTSGTSFDDGFQAALQGFERLPSPFDRGRTHLAWGRRLLGAGRLAEASTQLTLAGERFAELAATGWSERVSVELAKLGLTSPGVEPGAPPRLTRQEHAVGECVARGLTNKEAAAELFLTPKTIEWHLRQIYRKLGITSRTQLAAHLHARSANSAGPFDR